jgi:magnesium chelatase family protein
MLAKTYSCAVIGLEGYIVEVEVDISPGLPSFTVVGLPDTAVQEARERVRAAIRNSGYTFPARRITVNLAPAHLKKAGPAYDLPIAIGILISSGQLIADLSSILFLGELSLDGSLRHINGILSMASVARENKINDVFVPADDALEASLIENINIFPCSSIAQITSHLRGENIVPVFEPPEDLDFSKHNNANIDISNIKGQEHAKRAIEIAAAGGHNILMSGPPGSGKTMLARSLPGIIPDLSLHQAIDTTKIYSVCGLLPKNTPLVMQRPFRSPHYTISHAGLVGGGHIPRPGEISLSHNGVLFLDEFPEYSRISLESLRQPLEDKVVTISRAQGSVTFPANFMLVAAMNPCPCGYYGDPLKECKCSSSEITRYHKRISGPLLDRIDMFIEVPRIEFDKLTDDTVGETSSIVKQRIDKARAIQTARFQGNNTDKNSDMSPVEIKDFCKVEPAANNLLKTAMRQINFTARSFHRVLKLARTIADLDNSEIISTNHIAEALQYRQRPPI